MANKYTQINQKVERAIKASGQKSILVDYSAYETDGEDEPVDNLDDIAVKGKVILIGHADSFYGGSQSRDYRSEVLTDPPWLQVCIYANEMIFRTRDQHHVFLEGLEKAGVEGDVTVYEFLMGS